MSFFKKKTKKNSQLLIGLIIFVLKLLIEHKTEVNMQRKQMHSFPDGCKHQTKSKHSTLTLPSGKPQTNTEIYEL